MSVTRGFRGGSAEAVVALTGQLRSELTDPALAAAVGEDLYAAATVLRREGTLRRFATDASVPADARAGVVADLFRGKVGEQVSLDLLTAAARRRWTAGRDLPDALEQLSVVARVIASGDPGRLSDELFAFAGTVQDNPELRDALSDRTRSPEERATLVDSLLGGKVLPATLALAKQALGGSYRTVTVALDDYGQLIAAAAEERVATVRVARPLTEADERRLQAALSRQYGREVHLHVVVEPEVLGGIKVEIGDDVIDGTVSSRLDDARRRLAG